MISNFPLCWPQGQPRTPPHSVKPAPFKMDDERSKRELVREITLLGGRGIIISSNVPVRQDGMPYADAARRKITDAGVAVYFDLKGDQKCFACDRWWTPRDNIRAIGMSISALRGMERWGSSDIMDRAFRGFTALPPPISMGPPKRRWRDVLDVGEAVRDLTVIHQAWRAKARENHPDSNNGNHNAMAEINAAWDEAQKELST